MGFVAEVVGGVNHAIAAVGDAIAPGLGKDLALAADLVAAYYLPGVAGQFVGNAVAVAGFEAGMSASTALALASTAQAATSLLTLSAIGGSIAGLTQQQGQVSTAMSQGLLINTSSNIAPLPVIYGNRKVGGTRTFVNVSGANNEYLHIIIVIGEGEIQSVNQTYIDDVAITDAKFSGLVTQTVYVGTDAQAADTSLATDLPALWGVSYPGSGVAYAYLKLKYDSKAFNGFPQITFDVNGRKVYDPRTTTTVFSKNPALCVSDYLTNSRYGAGISASMIDDASFISAANYCEELVTTPAGNASRYECNGVINVDSSVLDNLRQLLSSCRGTIVFSGGKYKIILDRVGTSAFAFNEDNITGSWSIATSGRRKRYNRVTASFFNPANNWQPDMAISDSSSYRTTVDNSLVLEGNIDLPFTSNYYTAQQLAGLQLKQSRFGLVVSFTAFQSALRCEVGDVVSITHSTPGWNGKLFRISQMTLRDDEEIEVVCSEYDATVYNLDTLTAITATPTLSLPNPFAVSTPAGVALTSGTADLLSGGDGTIISRIKCAWTVPADTFSATAEIQYKLTTSSAWLSIAPSDAMQGSAYIAPVKDGISYDVRIRFVNTVGVPSAWVQPAAHLVVGKTAAPSDVAGLAYLKNEAGIQLSWNTPADKDYQDTTIKYGASWAAGTVIYTGSANTFLWTRPTGTAFNIWAKHRDTSLNESTNAALLAVTYAAVAIANSGVSLSSAGALVGGGGGTISLGLIAGTLTSGQIAAGIISANAFAAGIEPVSVVSTTPGTKTTNTIFNTTTQSLLSWNGTAYVAAAGGLADGSVTVAKFAAGIEPVTVVSSVPGTKSTNSIVNTTDGKLYRWNGTAYTAAVAGADIVANSITAAQIATDTITAGQIAAGAIGASEIAAGAVVTSKLLVTGRGAALNDDPNTQDASAWTGAVSVVTDTTCPVGPSVMLCTGNTTVASRTMQINPARNYQMRIWVKQASGSTTTYLTVYFHTATGATVFSAGGTWPAEGSFNYWGLVNGATPAAWTEYVCSFGPNETYKIPAGLRNAKLAYWLTTRARVILT